MSHWREFKATPYQCGLHKQIGTGCAMTLSIVISRHDQIRVIEPERLITAWSEDKYTLCKVEGEERPWFLKNVVTGDFNRVRLFSATRVPSVKQLMDAFEDHELGNPFVEVRRGRIINLEKIDVIFKGRKSVKLKGSRQEFPISRRCWVPFKSRCLEGVEA